MSVRTGAAIIATLKAFGVLVAILELFTGPHFFANFPITNPTSAASIIQTTTTLDPLSNWNFEPRQYDDEIEAIPVTPAASVSGQESNNFNAFRFASTLVYLLIEAVAVSCLFYALRRQRPKFVIPEMAVILVCMSFELIIAILVIVGASFGSESLVQMVVNRMREQGTEITSGDVDQIRRLMPFVLTAVAFSLVIGAAFEFWFFKVLKGFYRYLQDKSAFGRFDGDMIDIQHRGGHTGGYINGYQPMMEESVGDEISRQNKDMPPAYQEIIQQQEKENQSAAAMIPPPYKEMNQ